MVEVEIEDMYISFENTKDGDIVEIIEEGQYEMKKVSWSKDEKKILNIPVRLNDKKIIWSPWNKDSKKCIEAWGKDTKNWVGMKFEIVHMENKMLIRPIVVEKVK